MNITESLTQTSTCKNIVVLGSTGSIGYNVLDIAGRFPERFRIMGLAAGRNVKLLQEQISRFKPRRVAVLDKHGADKLKEINANIEVLHGQDGFIELAEMDDVDMVISAQVGAAGLKPTFAAVSKGKNVGLANKETLVIAGELIMAEASHRGAAVLPIDSEHSAIYQSLQGHNKAEVKRIILTASGGPLRSHSSEMLNTISPEEALAHPTWQMGAKISMDSATMMNKGLEAIEAKCLFGVSMETIDVHIHPQSIIHSMVEYKDGSIVAQLSIPDMRIPIAYAMAYPQRLPLDLPSLNLFEVGALTFEKPNWELFPCLGLAFEAGKIGGTMPAVLNAANEVAVRLFLEHTIGFKDIPLLVEKAMNKHQVGPARSLEDILQVDRWTRGTVLAILKNKG